MLVFIKGRKTFASRDDLQTSRTKIILLIRDYRSTRMFDKEILIKPICLIALLTEELRPGRTKLM